MSLVSVVFSGTNSVTVISVFDGRVVLGVSGISLFFVGCSVANVTGSFDVTGFTCVTGQFCRF